MPKPVTGKTHVGQRREMRPNGDAAKILSIVRYWIGSGGNTLPRLEGWQVMHLLPYSEAITEDVYGDLFKSVGCDEDGVQRVPYYPGPVRQF